MGFDIKDIVSFMVSPVVSIINDLSTANMFDEYMYKVSIDDAINILKGQFPLRKFFYGSTLVNNEYKAFSQVAFDKIHKLLEKKL
jgi:hypothetical protein